MIKDNQKYLFLNIVGFAFYVNCGKENDKFPFEALFGDLTNCLKLRF